jgi:hypothetical protein
VRRAGLVVAAVLVALAGSLALVAVLQSRDDAGLARSADDAPGAPARSSDPRLRAGNILITHRRRADGPALRRLAAEIAGPADRALIEAGQAVIVAHRPGQAEAIVAHAATRRLVARGVDDPELRRFVEHWLGAPVGSS